MSIYLGNGHGGFGKPTIYDIGPDPTGLTVADVNGDGMPDLLVGNDFGDVLVLLGNGDGTFQPYRRPTAIALAVADLNGDGSRTSSLPTRPSTRSPSSTAPGRPVRPWRPLPGLACARRRRRWPTSTATASPT